MRKPDGRRSLTADCDRKSPLVVIRRKMICFVSMKNFLSGEGEKLYLSGAVVGFVLSAEKRENKRLPEAVSVSLQALETENTTEGYSWA